MMKNSYTVTKGLPKEYSAFRSAIQTRSTTLTFDELATMLGAKKSLYMILLKSKKHLLWQLTLQDLQIIPIIISNLMVIEVMEEVPAMAKEVVVGTFLIQVHNLRTSHKASNSQYSPNQFSQRTYRPICHICGKTGHLALDCYHRMDYAY